MFAVGVPIITTTLPSIGSLLGTSGNLALVNNINQSLGGDTNWFGSMMDNLSGIRNVFIDNVITPIKSTIRQVENVVKTMLNPDVIRPLITLDDFRSPPPSMHLPILTFVPVRELLEQGRITGYGYNAEFLPKEDVVGRLIDNGTVHDILTAVQADGTVQFVDEWDSTDPLYSNEELDHLEVTRNKILDILATTKLDPTDITEERG